MVRRLEKSVLGEVSVKMGRSNGRQAPTMPRDDSTRGQYKVGVYKSGLWSGGLGSALLDEDTYMLDLGLRCRVLRSCQSQYVGYSKTSAPKWRSRMVSAYRKQSYERPLASQSQRKLLWNIISVVQSSSRGYSQCS